MDELHTDGNAVAGLLSEVLAVDATIIVRRCPSCGAERPMADHRAYRGAGIVLRCPRCEDVAVRIGVQPDRLILELRGAFLIPAAER
jgi:predicted RNA-binding Zn-ribbon protein involved in translation (DUF1610 family)